jgi:hypothetical protein
MSQSVINIVTKWPRNDSEVIAFVDPMASSVDFMLPSPYHGRIRWQVQLTSGFRPPEFEITTALDREVEA